MKPDIRPPFFEIGVKNYIFGDDVLKLARAADEAAIKYDIDVLFIAPYADIRRIAEHTERITVLAPYMDLLSPGRGMADVLPESVKVAGARGVVLNHCERPMTLSDIRLTIKRAEELDMLTFACAGSIEEARAIACLKPDIINPEPSALIGKAGGSSDEFILDSNAAIRAIDASILVEQAAGIRTGAQVYHNIMLGADGVGVSSGIVMAEDPLSMADEMIRSVKMAFEDRKGAAS